MRHRLRRRLLHIAGVEFDLHVLDKARVGNVFADDVAEVTIEESTAKEEIDEKFPGGAEDYFYQRNVLPLLYCIPGCQFGIEFYFPGMVGNAFVAIMQNVATEETYFAVAFFNHNALVHFVGIDAAYFFVEQAQFWLGVPSAMTYPLTAVIGEYIDVICLEMRILFFFQNILLQFGR